MRLVMARRVDKIMRLLKALVIGMGIAIVVGASVLATLIFQRGSQLAARVPPVAASTSLAMQSAAHKLVLPAGAVVQETRLDGGRIALRARLTGGGEAVFLFDAGNGRLLSRFDIVTGESR